MKQILKNPEPQALLDWKTLWPDMVPGWAEFDGAPIKRQVKAALLAEQGGVCCFCENRVDMDHGHIAHLHAQADHEDLVLAYDNLLYSCPENKRAEPQTCGHAQGRKELPISPLDADCETRFAYTATGSIIPRIEDDEEAMETIRILNLDDRRSVQRKLRAEAFLVVDEFRQMITPDEFTLWIGEHLKRQPDGTFRPFWTTRKYAAGLYS